MLISAKRPLLINNEIYHVVVRGAGDSLIFKNESDYYRGIFSIYEFNNANPVEIRKRRRQRKIEKACGGLTSATRDLLVEVLAFCFMPNHIHLLLKQLKDDGISKFMQKVGTGYASYFNKKYDRMGHLFQAKFRAVPVKTEGQLKNTFVYIHTNPISLAEINWKKVGARKPKKVIEFLNNYRWSSYLDYLGKENFTSVTDRELLGNILGGAGECRKFTENWIFHKKDEIKSFGPIVLE